MKLRIPFGFTREQYQLILTGLGIDTVMCEWTTLGPIVTVRPGQPPDRAAVLIMKQEVSCIE